ncbi:ABC transporter substrate-binding protein [Effusibacillus pohliae]|uniref:ABC transporter substrate-binding protein n=1 Tax=Effusibacillus pohliae TaxID=232270 RepID=UPI00036DE874|nr:ABC transporter substrate-binding protein [Effusibacillus pohliae]
MHKKAKMLSGILAATLVMMGLAGCSGANKEQASQPAKEGEKITLRVGGWASSPEEQAILDAQIAEFKKNHPNIDVKFEPVVGDYLQKLQPMIASKTEPDIFYLDAYAAPEFMDKGVIEPIDEYVKKNNVNLGDYEDAAVKAFQWKGKTYGLPKDYSTLALFYNKDMLDKAGVKPPTNWTELREAAKKLTKDGVVGFSMSAELPRYQPFLMQAGGSVYDGEKATFSKPENATAIDFIYGEMMKKDKIAAYPKTLGKDWSGDAFADGKAAMVVEGPWLIPHLAKKSPNLKYGITELPVKEGGKPSNMIFTVAYALSKNSKHKQEAFELMVFLTGKEGQKFVVEKGLAIPTNKELGKDFATKYPERAPFVKAVSYATPFQYGTIGVKLVDAGNKAAEAVLLGAKPDAKAALEEAQAKMGQ